MQRPGKRITRKELKEDQLVTTYFKARTFFEKHGKTAAFGLAGLVVAAIVVYLVINSRIQANIAASNELFQAQMMYNRGGYQEAGGKINLLIDSYSGTRNAGEAHVLMARVQYKLGNYDSTEYYTDRYLDDYSGNSILTAAALAVKGASLEQRERYLDAAEAYLEAAQRYPRQFTAPMYLLDAGRCFNMGGENDKAIECYEKLIDNYPESELVGRANQQLARAGGMPKDIPIKVDLF